MIIDSNNKVHTLEDDLMPFLQKERLEQRRKAYMEVHGKVPQMKEPEEEAFFKLSSFKLDSEFEWIRDAAQ